MTFAELENRIPEWIKYIASKKNFKYGVSYRGWTWSVRTIKRKLQLNFMFYYPNGTKMHAIIVLPSEFFKNEPMKELDTEAKIINHTFSEENLIRVRFMYVLWWLYDCLEKSGQTFDEDTTLKNPIGIDVSPTGYLDYRQF